MGIFKSWKKFLEGKPEKITSARLKSLKYWGIGLIATGIIFIFAGTLLKLNVMVGIFAMVEIIWGIDNLVKYKKLKRKSP